MSKNVVIGSANIDITVKISHLSLLGEITLGGDLLMNQGGKGANQTVNILLALMLILFVSSLELIIGSGDN